MKWIAVATMLFMPAICFAQEMSQDEFLREYTAASKLLRAQYRQSVVMESVSEIAGKEENFRCVYFGNGEKERLDRKDLTGNVFVRLKTGDLFYEVTRLKGNSVDRVWQNIGREYLSSDNELQLNEAMPFAAFSIFETSIVDFLRKPDVAIRSVRHEDIDGNKAVVVSWDRLVTNAEKPQEKTTVSGTLTFDPERLWLLSKLTIQYSEIASGRLERTLSYREGPGKGWFLNEVRDESVELKTGKRGLVSTTSVVSCREQVVPEETFSLSLFQYDRIEVKRD